MQNLLILILGSDLYNILLDVYPAYLGTVTILFTLIIILMFFKLMSNLTSTIN